MNTLDPDRLRKARQTAGLKSAEELAHIIGVSPAAARQWEAGYYKPRTERLKEIAEACSTTVDYLLGNEDYEVAHLKALGIAITEAPELIKKRLPLAETISDILDIILLIRRGGNLMSDWKGGIIEQGAIDGDFVVISKIDWDDIKVGDKLCCFLQEPKAGDTVVYQHNGEIAFSVWPCDGVDPLAVMKFFIRNR